MGGGGGGDSVEGSRDVTYSLFLEKLIPTLATIAKHIHGHHIQSNSYCRLQYLPLAWTILCECVCVCTCDVDGKILIINANHKHSIAACTLHSHFHTIIVHVHATHRSAETVD